MKLRKYCLCIAVTLLCLGGCGKIKPVVLTPAVDGVPGSEAATGTATEYGSADCHLAIANMSGKDIESISISFSDGSLGPVEILGGETLGDGRLAVWERAAVRVALNRRTGIMLSAKAKDGSNMSFPELTLMDVSNSNLVIHSGNDGYELYLQ